jgi:hypothetical protein
MHLSGLPCAHAGLQLSGAAENRIKPRIFIFIAIHVILQLSATSMGSSATQSFKPRSEPRFAPKQVVYAGNSNF